MMSLDTIRSLQQDAREEAAKKHLSPYLVAAEDIEAWKRGDGFPLPFPSIGDYDPPGWEASGGRLFVDSSGFGADDEPALTVSQFLEALEPDVAYAIVEEGQFQIFIQPFVKV